MGNSVSELLSRSYTYLGTPTQDKLSLGAMLPIMLDTIDFYLLDLQISDSNHLLKQYAFTPTRKDDDIVTAPGFSVPVLMEIRDIGSTSDSDWRGILTADAADIQSLAQGGVDSVAFYGQAFQTMMRWSFDPVNDRQIQARLWYEPIANQPASLADSPKLSQAFAAMISLRCAMSCAPYAMPADDAAGLIKVLAIQLGGWEKKWMLWINTDRNQTVVQKRDYRGNRRRLNGYRGFGGLGW